MESGSQVLDHALAWDAFLEQEADRLRVPAVQRESVLQALRRRVDTFRAMEWLNLKQQIRKQTLWDLPESLEPHWVGPGTAILWQEQVRRVRVPKAGPDGTYFVIEEVREGWLPTSPLPFNNAGQIGQWLDLGMRLRPPVDGVSLETLREKGIEPLPPVSIEPVRQFWCKRHEKGPMGFPTWKGYIQHCVRYFEPPTETPPAEVLERAKSFKYYCAFHDRGWNHKNLASRHRNAELRRPGKAVHATLEEMEVK